MVYSIACKLFRLFSLISNGCLSTTVNVLCWSKRSCPAGVLVGSRSNLQSSRARISRISAHPNSLPMHERGPTPNGCIALSWSFANLESLFSNHRSGWNSSGSKKYSGERDTVNACTLTKMPSGRRSPQTIPPPCGTTRGAPTGLLYRS